MLRQRKVKYAKLSSNVPFEIQRAFVTPKKKTFASLGVTPSRTRRLEVLEVLEVVTRFGVTVRCHVARAMPNAPRLCMPLPSRGEGMVATVTGSAMGATACLKGEEIEKFTIRQF